MLLFTSLKPGESFPGPLSEGQGGGRATAILLCLHLCFSFATAAAVFTVLICVTAAEHVRAIAATFVHAGLLVLEVAELAVFLYKLILDRLVSVALRLTVLDQFAHGTLCCFEVRLKTLHFHCLLSLVAIFSHLVHVFGKILLDLQNVFALSIELPQHVFNFLSVHGALHFLDALSLLLFLDDLHGLVTSHTLRAEGRSAAAVGRGATAAAGRLLAAARWALDGGGATTAAGAFHVSISLELSINVFFVIVKVVRLS